MIAESFSVPTIAILQVETQRLYTTSTRLTPIQPWRVERTTRVSQGSLVSRQTALALSACDNTGERFADEPCNGLQMQRGANAPIESAACGQLLFLETGFPASVLLHKVLPELFCHRTRPARLMAFRNGEPAPPFLVHFEDKPTNASLTCACLLSGHFSVYFVSDCLGCDVTFYCSFWAVVGIRSLLSHQLKKGPKGPFWIRIFDQT